MTVKLLLAKGVSRGNLISPNYEQYYYVFYLPKVIEGGEVKLCDKIRLELVAPSSNGEDVVKSYQMIDPSQVDLLIFDLMKASAVFHKKKGTFNIGLFQYNMSKKAKEIADSVAKGVYDNGI